VQDFNLRRDEWENPMQRVSRIKEEESNEKKRERRKHQERKEYEDTPTEGPGREEAQVVSHEFGIRVREREREKREKEETRRKKRREPRTL
jgi:hypothetical protein